METDEFFNSLFYINFVKMQCIFTLLLKFLNCQHSHNKAAGKDAEGFAGEIWIALLMDDPQAFS